MPYQNVVKMTLPNLKIDLILFMVYLQIIGPQYNRYETYNHVHNKPCLPAAIIV